MGKTRIFLVCLIISLLVNIVVLSVFYKNSNEIKSAKDFAADQMRFPLLSKRILLEFPQDILLNFLDLRTELRNQVKPYGESFGLYFEYLPTGTTIGINEKVEFHAASLFKIPVVMAYYRFRERTHRQDDPEITIKKDQLDDQFGDLWKKGEGARIKASDAVRLTITESDNTAAKTLVPFIEPKDFEAVYQGLDIDLQSDDQGALISAKNYSSILKSLYFSSVLDKESSEEILDLLTKTKFPDKLAAGVPSNVLVAHKIGDFVDSEGNEGFRDCGIVYVPRRPYVLCIFSVGNEQLARERMQKLSKTIYDYVSSVK